MKTRLRRPGEMGRQLFCRDSTMTFSVLRLLRTDLFRVCTSFVSILVVVSTGVVSRECIGNLYV